MTGLTIGMIGLALVAQAPARPALKLRTTCLITRDVKALAAFYRAVLQIEPVTFGGEYVEFRTGAGTLALYSAEAQERYLPGSAKPASNSSAILEFEVADVDQEYARLQSTGIQWVKKPANTPWGTRSFYFRDPEGHLVNFHARLK